MKIVAMVGLAALAGLVVFGLITPVHGAQTIPVQCFSLVGFSVPCETGVALVAGIVTAGVVGLWLWLRSRHESRSKTH